MLAQKVYAENVNWNNTMRKKHIPHFPIIDKIPAE